MTEHGSDATTTGQATTTTTTTATTSEVSKTNGICNSESRSSSSSSSRSRSPTPSSSTSDSNGCCSHTSSPILNETEQGLMPNVNLLHDSKFLQLIEQCAQKRNSNLDISDGACVLDAEQRIVGFGSGVEGDAVDDDLLCDPQFLMHIAQLAAQHSADPKTKVGACIVDGKNRIVGIGYNRFPVNYSGVSYPWLKSKDDPLLDKRTYVVHAEADAIIGRSFADLRGATIYSTLLPCNECAKLIIQSGIRKVYYKNSKLFEKWIYKASRRLLNGARVELQKLQ